jgi:homocitrate synthase
MIVGSRDYVTSRYKLHKLKEIEDLVASNVEIVRQNAI